MPLPIAAPMNAATITPATSATDTQDCSIWDAARMASWTAIGDHLIRHSLGCDGVGNDGAAECSQHLIDDITDGQRLRVAVAHLPQQQLGNGTGENKEDDVRQVSAHNGADNAVNEDRTGLFHLRADDEVDDALQQGEKHRHQNDGNGRCVQDGAGEENDHIDQSQQDTVMMSLIFSLFGFAVLMAKDSFLNGIWLNVAETAITG